MEDDNRVGPIIPRIALFLFSIVLALVWIRSATSHAGNPYYFLSTIHKYQLVSPRIATLLAIVLPSLQFSLAVCLLSRLFVKGAVLASALLLTVFGLAQSSALARGLKIDCGCFGPASSNPIDLPSIATVLSLAACAYLALGYLVYSSRKRQPL